VCCGKEIYTSAFNPNIKSKQFIFSYVSFFKYILILISLILPLLSLPAIRIYIILCHSEIFLVVPSPSGGTKVDKLKCWRKKSSLGILYLILIYPYISSPLERPLCEGIAFLQHSLSPISLRTWQRQICTRIWYLAIVFDLLFTNLMVNFGEEIRAFQLCCVRFSATEI
jgi:hypothetical protein